MTWLITNWDTLYLAVTSVVGTASAIAALTPTPKDDTLLAQVRKIVGLLALNVGHAGPGSLPVNGH